MVDADPRKTLTLGNCGDRPRPVGFDVTNWRGGGAAHDPGFGAVELDRQRGFGDRDGEGLPGMDAAQGDLLPTDHHHPGCAGTALHPE
jgi:hypothetical protein